MGVTPDLLILVDALRHDYGDDSMPFLQSLAKQGGYASVIETCAFQTRPAYLAGLEPDESDICHLFERNEELSPFDFLRPFCKPLSALDGGPLDGITRKLVRRIAKSRAKARGHDAAADVMETAKIPLQLLWHFALSERVHTDIPGVFQSRRTLFDLLRDHGRTYRWIGYPRHYGSSRTILGEIERTPLADLNYIHLSELDWVGHRDGPDTSAMEHARREMDGVLKRIVDPVLQKGGRAVIFGDHGMVTVRKTVNALSLLAPLREQFREDLLLFLDSTQIRLWYGNSRARDAARELLSRFDDGHLLSSEERIRLHLNFSHRRYGDDIFALNGGAVVFPSFFDRSSPPRGMHGYLPDVRDNMALVVAAGSAERWSRAEPMKMVELFDLFCGYFGLR